MVDCGLNHNIMPLSVMRTIGFDCTRHYQDGEYIFSIDSRSVLAYGGIKDFFARISFTPKIHIIFIIIVVHLPPTYSFMLGHECSYPLGGYLMKGSCMMLPSKYCGLTRISHETNKSIF